MNAMVVRYAEIEAITRELHAKLESLPKQIEMLRIEQSLCDQELADIQHIIEFSSFNACEGYKNSRDMQITLQKRREVKNELESLSQLEQSLKTNRSMTQQLVTANKMITKRKEVISSKRYTPRVRSDLIERFNRCNMNKLLK